jgi:hypothetical protein
VDVIDMGSIVAIVSNRVRIDVRDEQIAPAVE